MQKINGADGSAMTGFVLVDLDDAPVADGVVRSAKKILIDGARTLARSRTYAWALLGQQVSGASAGVNAAPDDHSAAMGVFVEAVMDRVSSGTLSLDPGKGVDRSDLSLLAEVDSRSPLISSPREDGSLVDELLATSVVAAASAALGGLEGRSVAVEGAGSTLTALLRTLAAARARVVAVGSPTGTATATDGLDVGAVVAAHREHGDGFPAALGGEQPAPAALSTPAEVLICGSKAGLIDHTVADGLGHRVVAPVGAVPVTAKGLAVSTRRGVVVLPDFLTTSGPLHAFRPASNATAEELLARANEHAATLTSELLDHPDGPLIGACLRAEDFLRTWRTELPFGRPLA